MCIRRFTERATVVIIAPNGFACLPRANIVGEFSEKPRRPLPIYSYVNPTKMAGSRSPASQTLWADDKSKRRNMTIILCTRRSRYVYM